MLDVVLTQAGVTRRQGRHRHTVPTRGCDYFDKLKGFVCARKKVFYNVENSLARSKEYYIRSKVRNAGLGAHHDHLLTHELLMLVRINDALL